jgi:DNA-binding LacI/PurR family transcriptional regulator
MASDPNQAHPSERRPRFAERRGLQGRPLVVMADVAKAAGVSKQTVSRVVNENPIVSGETRERVLTAIRALGYQPNSAARALVTGQTGTLGVLMVEGADYGPVKVLQGISQAAGEAGYVVSVAPLRSFERRSVQQAITQLLSHAVDGLITVASHEDMGRVLRDLPHKVPVVALDDAFGARIPTVTVDEEGGAQAATEHLLALGHRTVWHISGPENSPAARGRVAGWHAALEKAGVEIPDPMIGDWTAGSGYQLGCQLARRPGVTAIFAGNDHMALGALRAMYDLGRNVPADVSVIGFDDIPEAPYLIPPLSTVRPDFVATGRRCLALLLDQIRTGVAHDGRYVIPVDLVIRHSVGAVPAG